MPTERGPGRWTLHYVPTDPEKWRAIVEGPPVDPKDKPVPVVPVARAEKLAEALREIGALGGPLYLLDPNQGERPNPVLAAQKLREIITTALAEWEDGG